MTAHRLRSFLFLIAAGVLSALFSARTSHADPGAALVVIVTADPRGPTVNDLKVELEGLGLAVMVLNATAENSADRDAVERAARNVGAVAAIRLVPSGAGVEVWVTDRVTGKTIVRDLATPSGPSGDAVALGAVELLRASFMELHADVPHRGEVAPTPQVKALALPEAPRSEPRRASLAAGAGVGVSAAGASGDAQIAVAAPLWKGLGVRAFASLPLVPAQRHVPEGVIRLSSQQLALFLSYDWLAADSRWFFATGLGAAAAHVSAAGEANATATGRTDATWLGGGALDLGTGFRLTHDVRLRLDGVGIMTTRNPDILVVGRPVTHWGNPLVLVTAGVEVLLR